MCRECPKFPRSHPGYLQVTNPTEWETQMKLTLKKAATGTCLGLVLASGSVFAATAPSNAATPAATAARTAKLGVPVPGAGDVIGIGKGLFDAFMLCEDNRAAGLPCTQSTAKTVSQMYAMLASFTARYDEDQKRTRESFDQIINLQHDANVKNEYNLVRNDLETTYVGLQLLKSYGDCTTKFVSGTSEACMKVNKFGVVDEDGQAATAENIGKIRDAIIANDEGVDGSIGFKGQDAPSFAQHVGGRSADDPYSQTMEGGLLPALLSQAEAAEVHNQGLTPGAHLTYFPSSFVNKMGDTTQAVTQLEEGYFSVRVAASQMKGKHEDAKALTSLALSGRGSGSPVLSISQQRKSFQFPGWTPDTKLADNQAYFIGKKSGGVMLTNEGNSNGGSAPTAKNLPTTKQLQDFGSDFGSSYVKLQKLHPAELPVLNDQAFGNPNAVARLWSAPQPTWKAAMQSDDKRFDGACTNQMYRLADWSAFKSACKVQTSPTVTVVGESALVNKDGKFTIVDIPASELKQQSVPFSIFAAPVDTQKGWGDGGSAGETPVNLPASMTDFAKKFDGLDVRVMSPRPGTVSADPTWAAYTRVSYELHRSGHHSTQEIKRQATMGPGVTIEMDANAGNLEMVATEKSGLLR